MYEALDSPAAESPDHRARPPGPQNMIRAKVSAPNVRGAPGVQLTLNPSNAVVISMTSLNGGYYDGLQRSLYLANIFRASPVEGERRVRPREEYRDLPRS